MARGIAGFVVEEGSAAGHAAILARALGLPALGGARGVLDTAEDGDEAVLDADDGQLVLRPEQAVLDVYARALRQRAERQAGWAELRQRPAATRDGVRLSLLLNVGLTMELDQLEETGADGIGLFRTEIAMLARGTIVDVAEQTAVYARVLDVAGDRPVLFRTLDLGGDKMLPGTQLDAEENPAMGWRSLRVGLDRPAMLRRQLKALLMAAGGRPLSIMFPMVSTVAEFRAARALLDAELARVARQPARRRRRAWPGWTWRRSARCLPRSAATPRARRACASRSPAGRTSTGCTTEPGPRVGHTSWRPRLACAVAGVIGFGIRPG